MTSSSDSEEGSGASSVDEEEKKRRKEKKEKEKERKKKRAQTVREPNECTPSTRKKKSKKDPNAPKRPLSAFFLWLNENRESIKEENLGISISDLAKRAGELWRDMDASIKVKYDELAKKAKRDYKKAMAEYYGNANKSKPAKKRSTPSAKKSPKKESHAGAGSNYKSKEFISTSESNSESDEDKPLKKKSKKEKVKKEKSASEASSEASKSGSESGSASGGDSD